MKRVAPLLPLTVLLACAPAATPAPQPALRWSATLEARPALSELQANVTAVRAAGSTSIQIEVTGGIPGTTHPWHLHHGTCESGGGIVGDPDRYPALQVGAGGRALETAVIDTEIEPGQPYHVNVHRSTDELGAIVACGNLRESGPR